MSKSVPYFLKVIQFEYNKRGELKESLREIAYEIVAPEVAKDTSGKFLR